MSSHVLLKTLFSTSKKDILFHPPVRKPEAIDNTHPRQDILLLGDIIFKNALKKPENKAFSGFFIRTGDERIELPPKVLETPIIPVDQSPTFRIIMIPQNFIHNRHKTN